MQLYKFSMENLKRCVSKQGFHHNLKSWSFAEWTNAMAGEIGEACNITKKLLRLKLNIRGNKFTDLDFNKLKREAAKECIDSIIYADLTIQALGFNTEELLIEVFNNKSIEIGYNRLLNNQELSNLV